MTALITPFSNGKLDEKAFKALVERQVTEGTHAVVPCGTTGESPTLTHEEHMVVTEMCIAAVKGRVAVIAGAGSNSTNEAMALARHAEKAGADATLVVTPYYNKPTQAGLYAHFKAVHDACGLPLFIYNIPGRSVVDMSVETMARLAELPRIVGVKDATANLDRPRQTRDAIGADFIQISGEDVTVVPFLEAGGVGCISVTANIAPRACTNLHEAWMKGDMETVNEINDCLLPVHDAMFCESSPGPVKFAAGLMGLCSDEMRLPLCEIAEESKKTVRKALVSAGLLS
jgi:4-hydroxy-tetrahydrodipicolinate synthase